MLEIFYFFCILFTVLLVIALITRKKPVKAAQEAINAISVLKQLYNNNDLLSYHEILSILGVPEEYRKNDKEYLNFKENTIESDMFTSYMLAISHRKSITFSKLWTKENTSLNLEDDEKIYFDEGLPDMYEMKTIKSNISYTGARFSNGVLRGGNLSYTKNDIKDFVFVDYGRVYITNKRIIFVGKKNYKSLNLKFNNILTYYIYKDGILIITHTKPVLFKFEPMMLLLEGDIESNEIDPMLSDRVFTFVTVLTRILNGNQDCDLDSDI